VGELFQPCRNGRKRTIHSPSTLGLLQGGKTAQGWLLRAPRPQASSTSCPRPRAAARRTLGHHIFRPGLCSKRPVLGVADTSEEPGPPRPSLL